ncbi:hypothetical protein M0R45_027760 [Rubus argutus]|uniref:Vacuolar protein sorting-associated protein 51 homolog n=1 Tax=Rubus argutus TaxID=59490 RepID=A0AAW1X274_RUBAR
MEVDDVPLDDKAKRMRDLLSSFYSPDPSMSSPSTNSSSKYATLDAINTTSFDPDQYMNLLVHKSNLEGLLQRHVEMAAEIKNLDTDLQMLVYENYNKFISATDTIKQMKSNIVGMEANMEQLLEKIMSVQSRSDGVNTSLFEKREHIEKLHRTRNLLRKLQFIYDLPARLGKCIKSEAYADAVKFYTGAMPIFKAYGDSSFQDCKRASEEAVAVIIKNLQGKLFSDSESIQARAEAAVLLKQLDFPVDSLKVKLLEKLEQSVADLQLNVEEVSNASVDSNHPSTDSSPATAHEISVREFAEAIRIVSHLLGVLRIIWKDVLLLEDVLPEAALPDYSLEAAQAAVKLYVTNKFSHLQSKISDALTKAHIRQKDSGDDYSLQVALEGGKKAVLQGSMNVLLDFRQLLDDDLGLLVKLRDSIIDWVQEGFQEFFGALDGHFLLLSGRHNSASQDQGLTKGILDDKVLAGLVLVLAQISLFIEQNSIPRITEASSQLIQLWFLILNKYQYYVMNMGLPLFLEKSVGFSGQLCEKFLHLYIKMTTQRISILQKRKFTATNWVKHKEPREVNMFVDFFLHELEAIRSEVKQILPEGLRRHRRADSTGSTASSRSNPLREEKLSRSNTQRARSQLLETHLAKLFKQKVEIFTKVDFTQESVLTTVVKLCLKSLQEFVRLQTFNRSGFQQIQLDIQFLRTPLKELAEDEAAIDFLLDEVVVAAAERCLDPTPLEPPILDRLIQAKLAKTREQNPISP